MDRVSVGRAARYHAFLRRLRTGGRSNMYGAIPYLMDRFGLDRDTAFRVVCDWVDLQATQEPRAPARTAPPPRPPRRRAV